MITRRKFICSFKVFSLLVLIVVIITIQKRYNLIMEQSCEIHVPAECKTVRVNDFPVATSDLNLQAGPRRLVYEVDCQQIIEGDKAHLAFASELMKHLDYKFLSDDDMNKLAQNCKMFSEKFDYNRFTVSQEELDFPLAYSIIVHKDAVQIEILLRAIYRPHNAYCIHVDKSANSTLLGALKAISKCVPNIFIASKLEDVIYEGYSRLQADLTCMADLLNYTEVKWKYLINLPAQEYPLKTNAEIVKILRILNGTSSIESIYYEGTLYRVNETYRVNPKTLRMEGTGRRKDPPPYNSTVGKGNAYGAFSRNFVHFALHDVRAQELLEWTKDTFSPDETLWATLAMNKHLGAPGIKYTASGIPDQRVWITTSITWKFSKEKKECKGKYVRDVCIFGLGDLQRLVSKRELFANKFYHNYQPFALRCMEEWIFNKSFASLPSELYYYKRLIES